MFRPILRGILVGSVGWGMRPDPPETALDTSTAVARSDLRRLEVLGQMTAAQLGALLEGLDWRRVHQARRTRVPQIAG